jgi:hypothetical protein
MSCSQEVAELKVGLADKQVETNHWTALPLPAPAVGKRGGQGEKEPSGGQVGGIVPCQVTGPSSLRGPLCPASHPRSLWLESILHQLYSCQA